MNTFEIILIVGLVFGVIGSNLALLRYANKVKIPPSVKQHFEQPEQDKKDPSTKPEQSQQSSDKNDSV
ncbi:MAG: DUF2897 family protein [Gammaproteobacteria bacterium]|nr:DUF2897 family protein [Gammaproteobacteria bacterium]